jgi:hypothetical protein
MVLLRTDVSGERIIRVFLRSVLQLLVLAEVVRSSLIPFTLMMEVIHSSETSEHTRVTRCHIPEDGILQLRYNFTNLSDVRLCT